jgi:tyrosine-protein phosphatase YwqE
MFWPFHRRCSLKESGIFHGLTDWHSHILPDVDDGVQTMAEALETLSYYEQLGLTTVWLTPHVMEDIPNSTDALRQRFDELRSAYQGPIDLHLASENMIDNLFDQRLEAGDLLPLGTDARMLLVETSYFNPPMAFHQRLQRIKDAGYTPVLAHPERYVYMGDKEYKKLLDKGVSFQLNLPSLCNLYGPEARRKAYTLLKDGAYQRCGSDLHRLTPIKTGFETPQFKKEIINAVRKLCQYQEDL